MSRPRGGWTPAATLAAIGLLGTAAHAFVRSKAPTGKTLYWPVSCIYITPDDTPIVDLTQETIQRIIKESVANWQSRTAACTYMQLILDTPGQHETKADGNNVIKFRAGNPATDQFCRPANDKDPSPMCYSPSATAITTVRYRPGAGKPDEGQIWDADIELNAVNFTFIDQPSMAPARPSTTLADLENTLVHEIGHLQGLDHTCWDRQPEPPGVDSNGAAIPDCSDVAPCNLDIEVCRVLAQATMYNYARPGETLKREPKADDLAGICAAYPKDKDPGKCVRYGGGKGGCSVARKRGEADRGGEIWVAGFMVVVGIGGVVRLRRRMP